MRVELYDLLRFFHRHLLWLVIAAIVGVVVGWTAMGQSKSFPQGHVLVSLRAAEFSSELANPEVQYDGYYIIEAERRFGTLMAEILRSEELRQLLLGSVVLGKVERVSTTDYRVALTSEKTAPEAGVVLEQALNERLALLSEQLGEPLQVQASVLLTQSSHPLGAQKSAFAGALAGLLLGAFGVSLRAYYVFQNQKSGS